MFYPIYFLSRDPKKGVMKQKPVQFQSSNMFNSHSFRDICQQQLVDTLDHLQQKIQHLEMTPFHEENGISLL